jgi:plasmid stabilization system protein ParE
MSYSIILKKRAKEDIQGAFDWYEHELPGLGDRFLLALDDAFDRIKNAPLTPRLLRLELRTTLLKKFPYAVFYRVEDERIYVFGVIHGHQEKERILKDRGL